MDRIIGIDLAKQYFQVHASSHCGEVMERRKLTRDKVRAYMLTTEEIWSCLRTALRAFGVNR